MSFCNDYGQQFIDFIYSSICIWELLLIDKLYLKTVKGAEIKIANYTPIAYTISKTVFDFSMYEIGVSSKMKSILL